MKYASKLMADSTHSEETTEYDSSAVTPKDLRTNVTLSDDDLSEEAKPQFGYHTEILHAFQLNARSILSNNQLLPIGRHLFCMRLEQNYATCKSVLNYVAAHPEMKMTTNLMPPPLVLCGLARSGTTLLYNLLACDPACRAPMFDEMMQPVPPLARSDPAQKVRWNTFTSRFGDMFNSLGLTDYRQQFHASHPFHVHEEDLMILGQAGLSALDLSLVPDNDRELLSWFLDNKNKDFAYEYHKTFLRMLNSVDAPRSHWLLKTPVHAYFLDTLLRYYPSASLIMTHRRLDDAISSVMRLSTVFCSAYFHMKTINDIEFRRAVVERRLHITDTATHRLTKFRRDHPHVPVFDVLYDDLVSQPIDTVRRIYEHFGFTWSEEFRLAMVAWLRENPQGKQGRNTYALEEFELTPESIEDRYKEYNNMFLKPRV